MAYFVSSLQSQLTAFRGCGGHRKPSLVKCLPVIKELGFAFLLFSLKPAWIGTPNHPSSETTEDCKRNLGLPALCPVLRAVKKWLLSGSHFVRLFENEEII